MVDGVVQHHPRELSQDCQQSLVVFAEVSLELVHALQYTQAAVTVKNRTYEHGLGVVSCLLVVRLIEALVQVSVLDVQEFLILGDVTS
jgi:hypothetical protein